MTEKVFCKKCKEEKPVVAICYDFDRTLSPDDMQAQGFIQSVGFDTKDFWVKSNGLAEDNDMDQNLAYMYSMLSEAEGQVLFTRDNLAEYGAKVELFPGVEDWFGRMNTYGDAKGVIVEHYIISSGLKEMIEGTEIARKGNFEKIYASSFYFNSRGVAVWPAQVINYTNKTQFLFRIEKGVLDVNDSSVNDYFPPNEIRVPFRNMIYIGDSDTDIPCMKLVNTYGGHSIGVFNPETRDKKKVYKMMNDNRIKYFAAADYKENSELDILVKEIIDRTVSNEKLEIWHYKNRNETVKNSDVNDGQRRDELITKLENSRSFATTHMVVKELNEYGDLTKTECEKLFDIAVCNLQVHWILGDSDVANFYTKLLKKYKKYSEAADRVREIIDNELLNE